MRGVARTQVPGEQALGDDGSALRGNAFIIVGERAEARAVLLAGIGDNVHQVAAVAQLAAACRG